MTLREAFERAFTGSNRTALAWAAFQAGWKARVEGVEDAPGDAQRIVEEQALRIGRETLRARGHTWRDEGKPK